MCVCVFMSVCVCLLGGGYYVLLRVCVFMCTSVCVDGVLDCLSAFIREDSVQSVFTELFTKPLFKMIRSRTHSGYMRHATTFNRVASSEYYESLL